MKNPNQPLPVLAAQNARSVFTAGCRAPTEGSAGRLRVFRDYLGGPPIAATRTKLASWACISGSTTLLPLRAPYPLGVHVPTRKSSWNSQFAKSSETVAG